MSNHSFKWLIVYVSSDVPWPGDQQEVTFRSRQVHIRPETENHYADVSVEFQSGETLEQCTLYVRHFLSNLSWSGNAGIKEIGIGADGGQRIRRAKNPYTSVGSTSQMSLRWMSDPTDANARMALAFYREGLCIDVSHYRYLSLFKVINVLHDKAPEQIHWINSALSNITEAFAVKRIQLLTSNNVIDIGKYLVNQRRDAVAHAQLKNRPAVDPEDQQMVSEFAADLPLLKALVEYFIEVELQVKSSATLWRESKVGQP